MLAGASAGKNFHGKALAGAKELQGDTKAEGGVAARPQGERGVPAGKGTDTVVKSGLAPLSFPRDANGNADENETTVGRELTRL